MRVCLINCNQSGSTGQIVLNIADELQRLGNDVLCVFAMSNQRHDAVNCEFIFKNKFLWNITKIRARIDGSDGFVNKSGTKAMLGKIIAFRPDIIHLHNVHGEWIDVEQIINYAIANGVRLLWTAHDCWLETGRCAHFSFNECSKYKTGCGECPFRTSYPKLYGFDKSDKYWKKKRELLTRSRAIIFTPSKWLKNMLLDGGIENNIHVVGNPVDTELFRVGNRNDCNPKTIGFCCFSWTKSKGIQYATEIARYFMETGVKVVFVGLSQNDRRLPAGAIGVAKTSNADEVASMYRSFDVFVNPTMQDVFSMVNIESLMVGTPVVTFDSGGAAEMIENGKNGFAVPSGNVDAVISKISVSLVKQWDRASISDSVQQYSKKSFMERMMPFYRVR